MTCNPTEAWRIRKIVSGGQTGVDRASLDAALAAGVPCGGWCPRGRRAEDGPIPERYPLTETPRRDYAERTEWNVRDSDGTLVLVSGKASGGTALTIALTEKLGRPCIAVAPETDPAALRAWLGRHQVAVLNVAGPRESEAPGIHGRARVAGGIAGGIVGEMNGGDDAGENRPCGLKKSRQNCHLFRPGLRWWRNGWKSPQ